MSDDVCPLCDRPLGQRSNTSKHHLIPMAKGGKKGKTVTLHHICHRKIHAVFTNRQLRDTYYTIGRIREVEEIKTFVRWISKKPSEFYLKTKESKSRISRRNWQRR